MRLFLLSLVLFCAVGCSESIPRRLMLPKADVLLDIAFAGIENISEVTIEDGGDFTVAKCEDVEAGVSILWYVGVHPKSYNYEVANGDYKSVNRPEIKNASVVIYERKAIDGSSEYVLIERRKIADRYLESGDKSERPLVVQCEMTVKDWSKASGLPTAVFDGKGYAATSTNEKK